MNIILQGFYCRRGIFLIVATKMIDLVLSRIFRSNPTLSARFNSCYYIKLGKNLHQNKTRFTLELIRFVGKAPQFKIMEYFASDPFHTPKSNSMAVSFLTNPSCMELRKST